MHFIMCFHLLPSLLLLPSFGFWKQMDIDDSQLSFKNIPGGFIHGYSLEIYCVSVHLTYGLSNF